jgi:DNA-3-methyladenine glycosylase I
MSRPPERSRCGWPSNPLAIRYHDREWGVPVRNDRKLFEFLILEGAQAGLSWDTILAKRENYRKALDGFDFEKIALYDSKKKKQLLANAGIVRNRAKIDATIVNARAFIALREEFGSFSRYLWRFVDGRPLQGRRRGRQDVPARTEVSDALSKDLKKRGFKFVGTTIMYAFMQAVGMVNDHERSCFRHGKLSR